MKGDSIPLMAYSAQVRAWLAPHYERGGLTRIIEVDKELTLESMDPGGRIACAFVLQRRAWAEPTQVRIARYDGEPEKRKVRAWRLLGAQENQATFFEGHWAIILNHLDEYDLNRNQDWPRTFGAVWLPRGRGGSWAQFRDAVAYALKGEPWPHLSTQLHLYEPILMKYGDRLTRVLEG